MGDICYINIVKNFIKHHLPWLFRLMRSIKAKLNLIPIGLLGYFGLNVSRTRDYYSPLPVLSELKQNINRWNRPSELSGVDYDLDQMKTHLNKLVHKYGNEVKEITAKGPVAKMRLGPGIPQIDGELLYMMIRDLKPKKYFEVGSGSSTYYAHLAGEKNRQEGHPMRIVCIDPFPFKNLNSISSIEIIKKEVQDVDLKLFQQLAQGDVLFIDSTHVLKIDSDVSYLYLEVVPRLKNGVVIHSHDIPFPYNIPYPAEFHIMSKPWPVFWNEAMVVQLFLSHNKDYKITMSMPMVRYFDEKFLKKNIPNYKSLAQDPDTFSSLWFKKSD